jgi:LAS superfamily LD-carboxypeptidase LdcB
MTKRSRLLAGLAAVLLTTAIGCSSATDEAASSPDDITPQELADGENDDGSDGVEPVDGVDIDGDPQISELEETVANDDPEVGSTSEALSTCHKATGYRRGSKFSICVVQVDGKWVEAKTAQSFLKMRAAAAKRGVHIHVVSGFRTMAQQRHLYNLYLQGRGNLAARPGYSNHQSGHALDLNTSAPGVYSYLANHGRTYGFRRTVPSEKWHWEKW